MCENFIPIVIATNHLVSSMGLCNLYIHVHVPLIMFLYIHVQYKYVHCTCIDMYITIYLYICVHVHTYCMYCMYWCIYVHVQDRHTCICKYTGTCVHVIYNVHVLYMYMYILLLLRHASIMPQNLPIMFFGNSTKFALLCSKIFPLCSRICPLRHVKPLGESRRYASQVMRAT